MTYSELQSLVASYLHRTDLSTEIQGFIELAEARIYRQLRSPEMVDFADVTFVAGNGRQPLPEGYVGMRQVRFDGGTRPYALSSVGLHALPRFTGGNATDPIVYATEGLELSIAPAGDTTISLTYYRALPPLTDSNTNNAMLDAYPQLFLYGALLEGGVFIQDQMLGTAYATLFDSELARITVSNEWSRHGEAPQMSAIQ